jgi:hypothetical protein
VFTRETRPTTDEITDIIRAILARCTTVDDVKQQIANYATIVQRLLCIVARELDETEAAIRTLYATWADMTVEEFIISTRT